jgi:hypothetical protein
MNIYVELPCKYMFTGSRTYDDTSGLAVCSVPTAAPGPFHLRRRFNR